MDLDDKAVELSTTEIVFPPSSTSPLTQRCVNISSVEDDSGASERLITITFIPTNENDVFMNGNVANITIVENEGKLLLYYGGC
jgi:hypothetical protein